jgi:hypothetical protein
MLSKLMMKSHNWTQQVFWSLPLTDNNNDDDDVDDVDRGSYSLILIVEQDSNGTIVKPL